MLGKNSTTKNLQKQKKEQKGSKIVNRDGVVYGTSTSTTSLKSYKRTTTSFEFYKKLSNKYF